MPELDSTMQLACDLFGNVAESTIIRLEAAKVVLSWYQSSYESADKNARDALRAITLEIYNFCQKVAKDYVQIESDRVTALKMLRGCSN